jgi:hypothetical protein
MKFAIIVYEPPDDFDSRENEAQKQEYWAAFQLYTQSMGKAGVMFGGNALRAPHEARTVRSGTDGPTVVDGPYADTKEQLGGFFLIDVESREAAVEWAQECPTLKRGGSVEVRPLLEK